MSDTLFAPPLSQNFSARISREVISRWGARMGLGWIGLLALLAVFGPFLATSHPLLLSAGGHISSPMLANLNWADYSLLVTFFVVVALWFAKIKLRYKLLLLFMAVMGAVTLSQLLVSLPKITIYEKYRVAEQHGEYDWVIYAPIPYSPKDYIRDGGENGLEAPLQSSQRRHYFGTEENGADVLSRMIHASRIALGIGFIATGIALVIGVIIGGLMGYFSGIVDMLGMRLVEVFEAVPTLFLLLTFVAFFGRSLYIMMVIIGLTSWSGFARYIRAEYLKLREQEFVQAAIASGLPLHSVLFRHMLPNGVAPILVGVSFSVASAILAEAVLSFLGLGLVDDPSWGQMLSQAVRSASFNWWMAIFPGGAIFFTVLAYNLVGEAMRDAIDPHLKH